MLSTTGKVVLITGGTGGIGQAIAVGLARLGAAVTVVGRDRDRGRAAVEDIQSRSGGRGVELMLADLSSQQEIRRLAAEFMARRNRLDVLINNVGGLYGRRWETVDGIEFTLAINHLCPFLLTHLLLPALQAGAPSRVINLNSEGHRAAKTVNFDDLQAARWTRGFRIYSQMKLANLLFNYELARRLNPAEITVNAVHPGIVDTQLFRRFLAEKCYVPVPFLPGIAAFLVRRLAYRTMKFNSIETAAEGAIYLASSGEVSGVTGKYFDYKKHIVETSPASHDEALSKYVWKRSTELVGLREYELAEEQPRSR